MVGVSLVFMFVSMHMLLELVLCASYEFVNNFTMLTNFCNRKIQSIFDQVSIKHKMKNTEHGIAFLTCFSFGGIGGPEKDRDIGNDWKGDVLR